MEIRPDHRLQTKYFLQLYTLPLIIFLLVLVPYSFWIFMVIPQPYLIFSTWLYFLFWAFIFCFAWTIPGLILIPLYYRRIRYQIHEGEIVMSRGVITLTRRVVPIRAITNVSLRRGPYDRMLHIGSVKIETAGQMGAQPGQASPELALDGLVKYESVYAYILDLIRQYRAGYALTTELEPTPVSDTSVLLQKILVELKQLNRNLEKDR